MVLISNMNFSNVINTDETVSFRIYSVPVEIVPSLLFGKTKSTQKPLRLDKNGCPTSISLSGFVRKMSDETFVIFEKIFLGELI